LQECLIQEKKNDTAEAGGRGKKKFLIPSSVAESQRGKAAVKKKGPFTVRRGWEGQVGGNHSYTWEEGIKKTES